MNNIQKIIILGGPGSGKSTLALKLGKKLGLPVYHLDNIHIQCDVKKNGKIYRNNQILSILNNDSWIMDGNYRGTLRDRIKACDLVIFLDYPTYKLIYGVLSRSMKQFLGIEKDILNQSKLFDFDVIMLAYNWKKERRKDVVNILDKSEKIEVFKSRRKLNAWLKKKFKDEMRNL